MSVWGHLSSVLEFLARGAALHCPQNRNLLVNLVQKPVAAAGAALSVSGAPHDLVVAWSARLGFLPLLIPYTHTGFFNGRSPPPASLPAPACLRLPPPACSSPPPPPPPPPRPCVEE